MLKVRNRSLRDLALASLGVTVDSALKKECLTEIQNYPKSSWYSCEFRNCDLLLVYGGNNVIDKDNLRWNTTERSSGAIQRLVSKVISPYFYRLPRLIILRTAPNQELNWHVDCNAEEINSFQPKMRVLLQGKADDLYFMSKDREPLFVETTSDVYYMSGAYIHALRNTSQQDRYVLCLGSPWKEEDVKDEFLAALERQSESHLLWNDSLMHSNRTQYVRDPHRHGLTPYA